MLANKLRLAYSIVLVSGGLAVSFTGKIYANPLLLKFASDNI